MPSKKPRKTTKKSSKDTKTISAPDDGKKIQERTEKLFSDLGHLATQEPANQEKKPRAKKATPPPPTPTEEGVEQNETALLRGRVLELERQLQDKKRVKTPQLYEKERVGYAYKDNALESLAISNLGKKSEDKNALEAPITVTGQTIGSMLIEGVAERPWDPDEENLLSTIAQQASLQIQSLRLLESAERARTEAEEATRSFMHESWASYLDAIQNKERIGYAYDQASVTPYLNELSPDDELSETVSVMDEQVGKISLKENPSHPFTEDDRKMVSSVAEQIAQQVENIRLLADASRARAEAEEATRRLTQESWQEFVARRENEALSFTYDSIQVLPYADSALPENIALNIPLEVRGESIGRLAVAGDIHLSEEAVELASSIAAQANIHIESLRLLEETEFGRRQLDKRAAELETVAKVSTAAAAIRDSESLLRSVVDLTNYSFNLYHTSVYLVDNTEDGETTLKLSAASGKTGHKMLQQDFAIALNQERSIVAHAARKNKIIIVTDATNDPLFLAHSLLPDTKSAMAVPMIVAEKLIGIFNVEANTPNRFSEEDEQTYNTLAAQTAVALQNAQLYEEQIATVERLRELDHLKSSFLANMSHELRTPLNSISGFTQVMLEGLDGPLSNEMEEDLGLIDKNANHLLSLINEVLDMAKIEAGRLSVTLGPANLYEVLEDVVKTTAPLVRQNNLSMSLKNNIPEDLIIMADDMRIKQVMINIIGNSMKFTQEGTIQVEAKKDNDTIRIQVKDTGIGIPPELLETIFEAFSQVDTSTTRKAGGTGLGLPISKRFIEMHNGRLWAESTGISGEGSSFIVEIPIVLP